MSSYVTQMVPGFWFVLFCVRGQILFLREIRKIHCQAFSFPTSDTLIIKLLLR